ncbi:piggyBac transposable element-derived protein 4-like [Schistocerca nitens]|uniref:piggyBac transposable element-derived protein 4-like n=1 Tax=Schistocerca nitens TaxID=7011 RepID=UPI0021183C04|nr:piggyBac transposable element-derived protein 4-like [Schistocerca nitens]
MSRKSQEEMLMEWLEIPLSSDDDLECFSDDSIQDETYVAPESVDCDSDSSDEESQVPVIRTEDVSGTRQSDVIMKESTSQLSDNALKLPCSSKNVTKNSRSVVWKDKQLIIPELQSKFHGNTSLPEEVINLNTPYQFFKHIFPSKLFDLIVEQSHRYSVQCNPDRPIDLSCDDIKKFIGICLVMSIVHVPNTRDYWGEVTGTHLIKTTMTVNQYEQIRKFLHFNDNSAMIPRGEKGHDRLFKIRPIIELMRSRFQTIPVEECVSVDEQICSTKARSCLKQYMPNKPHKYGYKLFVISGISGYAHDFEIFTGDENEPEKRVTGEEDLGASANVVVRLSRILPRNMNHTLYCDNYYTSLPLLVWLHKQGIYSLGTVRRNRVPDCKLPSEAELKKMARGASVERVATVDGVDISNVVWKDNKSVMLLSTLAGQQPIHEAGSAAWNSVKEENLKKAWNKIFDTEEKSQGLIENDEQNDISEILGMLKEIYCHECDEEDVHEWMNIDDEDPGHQIMQDSEIVNVVNDKDDAASIASISAPESEDESIPTASEAFTCLDTALRWIEAQDI